MKFHPESLQDTAASNLLNDLSKSGIKWIGKSNMSYNTRLKERERPDTFGTIDNLGRNDKILGLDLFPQTADGRECNYRSNTDRAQSSNVGTIGNLCRGKFVVEPMTGEKGDGFSGGSLQDGYRRRGFAIWSVNI